MIKRYGETADQLKCAPHPELDHGAVGNRRGIGRRILMVASVLLLGAALGIGYWRHYAPHAQVMATAQRTEEPILEVRTALARANPRIMSVRLPAITQAFAQANIYARASGYITRREVDIGSLIKTGQLLVIITAQEVEHQMPKARERCQLSGRDAAGDGQP